MIQKCYSCGDIYGEKEPFEDESISHGLCESCFPQEMERIAWELQHDKEKSKC